PLSSLSIMPTPPGQRPSPPAGANMVAVPYDFGPSGATFSPPVTLTLSYDPALILMGVSETSLTIAWWNTSVGRWETLTSVVNTASRTVSAEVSHFTTFTVLTKPPTPTPIPSEGPPWLLIGGIAGGVIVIAVMMMVMIRWRED
ncbi:MAG: hypothetical protein V1849_05370, partial [Chloroflexota bacterium]